jgi:hypothetical protein
MNHYRMILKKISNVGLLKEEKEPYVDNITIYANIIENLPNILASPNWYANYSYNTSTKLDLKLGRIY